MLRPAKLVVVGFVTPRVNRCFSWVAWQIWRCWGGGGGLGVGAAGGEGGLGVGAAGGLSF